MPWFSKKQLVEEQKETDKALEKEIEKNVKKIDKTVEKAKVVGEKLNEVVQENGFTLKIFVATGGKLKGAHK